MRPATGEVRPFENAEETILFQQFVERGLGIPTCDFLRGLLFHYGIQLHHLNANSILHIAIFVHFCEAFLGIEPHFDLFCYLFHLKPQPSENNISEVGGASLQLSQGMEKKIHPIQVPNYSVRMEGALVLCREPQTRTSREDYWKSQNYR
jgi:hypothetical protein